MADEVCDDCGGKEDLATDDCGVTLCVSCAEQYSSSGVKRPSKTVWLVMAQCAIDDNYIQPVAASDSEPTEKEAQEAVNKWAKGSGMAFRASVKQVPRL